MNYYEQYSDYDSDGETFEKIISLPHRPVKRKKPRNDKPPIIKFVRRRVVERDRTLINSIFTEVLREDAGFEPVNFKLVKGFGITAVSAFSSKKIYGTAYGHANNQTRSLKQYNAKVEKFKREKRVENPAILAQIAGISVLGSRNEKGTKYIAAEIVPENGGHIFESESLSLLSELAPAHPELVEKIFPGGVRPHFSFASTKCQRTANGLVDLLDSSKAFKDVWLEVGPPTIYSEKLDRNTGVGK